MGSLVVEVAEHIGTPEVLRWVWVWVWRRVGQRLHYREVT